MGWLNESVHVLTTYKFTHASKPRIYTVRNIPCGQYVHVDYRPVRTEQFDSDLTGSAVSALAIESRLIQIELDPMKPPLVVVSNQFQTSSIQFTPVRTGLIIISSYMELSIASRKT